MNILLANQVKSIQEKDDFTHHQVKIALPLVGFSPFNITNAIAAFMLLTSNSLTALFIKFYDTVLATFLLCVLFFGTILLPLRQPRVAWVITF